MRKIKITSGFLALSLLCMLAFQNMTVQGSYGTFKQTSPGSGGRMPGILISPHNDQNILISNDMGSVFKSTDGGKSFIPIVQTQLNSLKLSIGGSGKYGTPWAWSPYNANFILAGTNSGFMQSIDGGGTWQKIIDPATNLPFKTGPQFVVFSYRDPNVVMAIFNSFDSNADGGSTFSLYKSYDGGNKFWSLKDSFKSVGGLQTGESVVGAMFDESFGPYQFIIGTNKRVLYQRDYSDSAESWESRSQGLEGKTIAFLDGFSRGKVFTAYAVIATDGTTSAELYRSTDNAKTWQRLDGSVGKGEGLYLAKNGSSYPYFAYIHVSRKDPNVIYMAYDGGISYFNKSGALPLDQLGNGGLLKSADGGKTWKEILIFKTLTDWTAKNNYMPFQKPDIVVTSPFDSNKVFTSSGGTLRSLDGGQNWSSLTAPPDNSEGKTGPGNAPVLSVNQYFFDRYSEHWKNHYLILNDFGLFKSTDWGSTWKILSNISFNNFYAMVSLPKDAGVGSEVWAAGGFYHDLKFKYQSHSDYYKQLSQGQVAGGIVVTQDDFATSPKFIKNIPGDSQSLPQGVVTALFVRKIANSSNREIWAGIFGVGIALSQDSGLTWKLVNTGLDSWNYNVIGLGLAPNTNKIYALVGGKGAGAKASIGGLFYLDPAAPQLTWTTPFSDDDRFTLGGMGCILPTSVLFHPKDPSIFYISTTQFSEKTGGVWRYSCKPGIACTAEKISTKASNSVAYVAKDAQDNPDTTRIVSAVSDSAQEYFGVELLANAQNLKAQEAQSAWTRITEFPGKLPSHLITLEGKLIISSYGNGIYFQQ